MTQPTEFDQTTLFEPAHEAALAQEERARLLLLDRISQKAATDEAFKRRLTEDPRKAIGQEAESLGVETSEAAIEQVQKTVIAFSPVLPGADRKQVESVIFFTIKDIRRSFNLTLWLSQVLFYSGLLMVVTAFGVALAGGEKLISLLFGVGGVGGVLISSLIMGPLDRVQNAAADLVQLQMAYFAYYNQLFLLGGSTKNIAHDDAIKYAHQIGEETTSLMHSIQEYVEKGGDKGERKTQRRVKPQDSATAPFNEDNKAG
jgi:hypothetical protein